MGMIRLLLSLAVVFAHAGGFGIVVPFSPQGIYFPVDPTIAVEMFFVISGFYMGLVLTDRFRQLDGWIWRFYVNRYFFRLMPAYIVVLITITALFNPILLKLTWDDPTSLLLKFNAASLIGIDLTAFYSVEGAPASGMMPIVQAWSLGIEIAFYVIVPFLVTLRTRTLVAITIALLCARLATRGADLMIQQRLFPFQFYFFMVGMLSFRLYRALPRQPLFSKLTSRLPMLALVIMILVVACGGYIGLQQWTPINSLYCTAGLALLMPSIFRLTKNWPRLADRWIGDLSYPVYLVHLTCGSFAPHARDSLWMMMAISIAVAVPMVVLVEIPMGWVRARMSRAPKPLDSRPLHDVEIVNLANKHSGVLAT